MFEDGGCIGRFPLATNENYVNKQTGEKVTNTEWHNIVIRNKAAEICNKYLKKGDKVYLEGKLKTRKWQAEHKAPDEDGEGRSIFEKEHIMPKTGWMAWKPEEDGEYYWTRGPDDDA